jgi:hypothetical protein
MSFCPHRPQVHLDPALAAGAFSFLPQFGQAKRIIGGHPLLGLL